MGDGNRGYAHLKLKEYNKSLTDSDTAIELAASTGLASDYVISFFNIRGQAHWALGHYEKAIDDYTRGLSMKPGGFLQRDQLEPLQGELHFHRAEALRKLKQNQLAEHDEQAARDLFYFPTSSAR